MMADPNNLPDPAQAVGMRKQVEKALCCPTGCLRNDDCFVEGDARRWGRSKREREQADAIMTLLAAQPPAAPVEVSYASYCPYCDLEHELHEDAQGFHHIVKGERVECCGGLPPAAPVAWSNEHQLAYLKDPQYSEIPMAMWAKRDGRADVPLYRLPPAAPVETDPLSTRLRNPMWAHSNASFPSPQLEQEENIAAMEEAADEIDSLCMELEASASQAANYRALLEDAEADVLRLHKEKVDMYERAIEAEAKLAALSRSSAETAKEITPEKLAEHFHPRPRGCDAAKDWKLAVKDAAKAIEVLRAVPQSPVICVSCGKPATGKCQGQTMDEAAADNFGLTIDDLDEDDGD